MEGKVAVTGAGFIGLAMLRKLAAEGVEAVGVDVSPSARDAVEAAGAAFAVADVRDARAVRAALAGCDAVVHTAAIVTETGAMDDFVAVNTRGTRNVLDAVGGRAVVLASVAGWGYDFRHDLPEDAAPRPCGNPYIDTKGATETLSLLRGATVIRPGDVYGPGSVPWVLRPLELIRARRFVLPDGGRGLMTPVHVDDLVDAAWRALRTPAAAGRAYTVWDGEAVPAREFFRFHARWLGRSGVPSLPRPLAALGARLSPGIAPEGLTFVSRRATYPNARAREELGWVPQVDLEDGMRRTEAWLRETGRL